MRFDNGAWSISGQGGVEGEGYWEGVGRRFAVMFGLADEPTVDLASMPEGLRRHFNEDGTFKIAAGTVDIGPGRAAKTTMILVKEGPKVVAKTAKEVPKLWKAMMDQLTKPKTTATLGKPFKGSAFEQTLRRVPNKTGPMSFWERVKHVIATCLEINMVNLIVGFFIGFLTLFFLSSFFKRSRERRGKYERQFQSKLFTSKIKDTLRHIVFEYSIKRSNNDFLLNINYKGRRFMQIIHRAHFPELCKSEKDIEFGLAVYIPEKSLTNEQVLKLESILVEESEEFDRSRRPVPYYVLDLGRRIRYGGYLLSRITIELLNPSDNDIGLELFSDGPLPYNVNSRNNLN